jgi:hypothetical protein
MKAASLKEIKTELATIHPARVQELCLHMAKFRKENKELLTYLLFEAQDEKAYIFEIKVQMDELFLDVNTSKSYLAKKTIRKILRLTNKFIKYSGSKQTEVELLIHFCKKFKNLGLPITANSVLGNIYMRQFEKIKKSLALLHEDLQFDYLEEVQRL